MCIKRIHKKLRMDIRGVHKRHRIGFGEVNKGCRMSSRRINKMYYVEWSTVLYTVDITRTLSFILCR